MKICFHKWSNWGPAYEAYETSSASPVERRWAILVQDRKCEKCGKIQSRHIRSGTLEKTTEGAK